jgi:hypothetical protein
MELLSVSMFTYVFFPATQRCSIEKEMLMNSETRNEIKTVQLAPFT